jgi:hypothetical protein
MDVPGVHIYLLHVLVKMGSGLAFNLPHMAEGLTHD